MLAITSNNFNTKTFEWKAFPDAWNTQGIDQSKSSIDYENRGF